MSDKNDNIQNKYQKDDFETYLRELERSAVKKQYEDEDDNINDDNSDRNSRVRSDEQNKNRFGRKRRYRKSRSYSRSRSRSRSRSESSYSRSEYSSARSRSRSISSSCKKERTNSRVVRSSYSNESHKNKSISNYNIGYSSSYSKALSNKKTYKSISESLIKYDNNENLQLERWTSVNSIEFNPSSKPSNFSDTPKIINKPIEKLSSTDLVEVSEKLHQINPLLGLNMNNSTTSNTNNQIINQNSIHPLHFNLNDLKIKRKIYIPKEEGVNFVGLLLGPKGSYQKRIESQSNCKILIRGKDLHSKEEPVANNISSAGCNVVANPEDNDEQHVLIIGDTDEYVAKAEFLVRKILFADAETRNKIREEQLKASQEINKVDGSFSVSSTVEVIEEHMMTPYGPPDKNARIVPVPNDCVGLLIGKHGETIRRLNRDSGCRIQIAKREIPNTDVRNVFIEGPIDKYNTARALIEEIVAEYQRNKAIAKQKKIVEGQEKDKERTLENVNYLKRPCSEVRVPNEHVGLVIGKNAETVKSLNKKTGCKIVIPKEPKEGETDRVIKIFGETESAVEQCKSDINQLLISHGIISGEMNLNRIPNDFNPTMNLIHTPVMANHPVMYIPQTNVSNPQSHQHPIIFPQNPIFHQNFIGRPVFPPPNANSYNFNGKININLINSSNYAYSTNNTNPNVNIPPNNMVPVHLLNQPLPQNYPFPQSFHLSNQFIPYGMPIHDSSLQYPVNNMNTNNQLKLFPIASNNNATLTNNNNSRNTLTDINNNSTPNKLKNNLHNTENRSNIITSNKKDDKFNNNNNMMNDNSKDPMLDYIYGGQLKK